MKTSNELREAFLKYFENKGHTRVHSSSLVPHGDETILFTNAGMNQFKDVFLGLDKRSYVRACSSQKCVRAGGKHNDLENVGYTPRHLTFFEMLGNFSFGDYFKEEAIAFAWEFLTKELQITKSRLYVSVYKQDDEAFNIWKTKIGIPESRIYKFDEDNFWAMGDTGPCGPCSEIFVDLGPKAVPIPNPNAVCGDEGRYVEIWNNVFMQFERTPDKKLTRLPKPSIDTGMGLERLSCVMQGVTSNYQTDLFKTILDHISELSKHRYGVDPQMDISMNVVADHLRSMTFLINDGVMPSNEGRGYVLRRIMRRAIRHNKRLGFNDPVITNYVPTLVNLMGNAYPELKQNQEMITNVIKSEEEKFLSTLQRGLELLEDYLKPNATLPGEIAFKLYDTFGFPFDLTKVIAHENKMRVDESGFDMLMNEQRTRAQGSWKGKFKAQDSVYYDIHSKLGATKFVGYEKDSIQSNLAVVLQDKKLVENTILEPGEYTMIFKETPFYPQGGGQVGDTGKIRFLDGSEIQVLDTQKILEDMIVHTVNVPTKIKTSSTVNLSIDKEKRFRTMCHHTGTHLLHLALRKVLGNHVRQAGSLVTPEILRFDFTHFEAMTSEQIEAVENEVNRMIEQAFPVAIELCAREDALKKGAMALFGEKYGDEVRVVSAGPSVELCGGCHVQNTKDLRLFAILSETSSASGVRRIEAKAGHEAFYFFKKQAVELKKIHEALHTNNPLEKIEQLTSKIKTLEKSKSLDKSTLFEGNGIIMADTAEAKDLKKVYDELKTKDCDLVFIFSESKGRVSILIGQSLKKRIPANAILEDLKKNFPITGGGKAELCQGGFEEKDRSKVEEYLKKLDLKKFYL